jgi:hypothetical protein
VPPATLSAIAAAPAPPLTPPPFAVLRYGNVLVTDIFGQAELAADGTAVQRMFVSGTEVDLLESAHYRPSSPGNSPTPSPKKKSRM